MRNNKFFYLIAVFIVIEIQVVYSQCDKYYIRWVGVVDNGEGDNWPHGPLGNLHIQLYDCAGKEISHKVLTGPSDNEFLDGDQAYYCIYIGTNECIRYVKIWESDGNTLIGIDWKKVGLSNRKHDMLFEGVPGKAGIWYSAQTANSDARSNAIRRGANSWVQNVWPTGIHQGVPALFLEVSCECY